MKDYTIHWRRSKYGHWEITLKKYGLYDIKYYSEHNQKYAEDVMQAIKARMEAA